MNVIWKYCKNIVQRINKCILNSVQFMANCGIMYPTSQKGGTPMADNRRPQYCAKQIAHYIIDKCTHDDHPISNLQLQLILYFLQGNNYRKYGVPLFSDNIYAWPYGPVVPEVYDEFCSNGATPICDLYDPNELIIDDKTKTILDAQIIRYRKKSVWDLVNESHIQGGPWDTVYQGYKTIIPKSLIANYFRKQSGDF